jgi:DNA-binding CsgD family transcriptional regulator
MLMGCFTQLSAQHPPIGRQSETHSIIKQGHDYLIKGNLDKTKQILSKLATDYSKLGFDEQIGYLVLSANYHDRKCLIDSALQDYQLALSLSKHYPIDAPFNVHLYLSVGHFYLHFGISDVAITFFEKVREISQRRPLSAPIMDAHWGIVRANIDLQQYQLAKKQALDYFRFCHKRKLKVAYISAYFWVGMTYKACRQPDSAKYYLRQIAHLPKIHPRDEFLKMDSQKKLVEILIEQNQTAEASACLTNISKSLNDSDIDKFLLQTKIDYLKHRNSEALSSLNLASQILKKELNNNEVIHRLKHWDKAYHDILELYGLSKEEASFQGFLAEFSPMIDSLKRVKEKYQIRILRKISIYTGEYYEQQRLIKDHEIRMMQILSVFAFFSLILVVLTGWLYHRRKVENQRKDIEFKTAEAVILQYEIEEAIRKENELKREIELHRADITDLALENSLKNKQTQELLVELKDIKTELKLHEKNNTSLDNLIKDLRNKISANERRDMLLVNIDKVNHDFYDRLSLKSQELTQSEKELCGLIRLQLSSKEISILRNITPKAVKMARYRLRKKLNLPSDEDLYSFMAEV